MNPSERHKAVPLGALESGAIDAMIADAEAAAVEFRRELHLDSPAEKIEFIQSVVALANCLTAGRRCVLIGFEGRRGEYHAPPDARLSQNRLQQLLTQYTEPTVNVRYEVVPYRAGPVGVIEVMREPARLPYRVRKTIRGETRRERGMVAGDVYVRHGIRTELPTAAELAALCAESEQARAAG